MKTLISLLLSFFQKKPAKQTAPTLDAHITYFEKPTPASEIVAKFNNALKPGSKLSNKMEGLAYINFVMANEDASDQLAIGINWDTDEFVYQE